MGASPLPVADPNDTQAWCRAFFAQLVACGVAHVAASPGSRSTPMTVAADRTDGLKVFLRCLKRKCTSSPTTVNTEEAAPEYVPLRLVTMGRPSEGTRNKKA